MNNIFQNIKAVGFDLDGTLYGQLPDLDQAISDRVAEKVLMKRPELENFERAKQFSEEQYKKFESRKKTLEAAGYENAGEVMREILREAESSAFLNEDKKLAELLSLIKTSKECMYLVTTAPEEEAKKKLKKLGVEDALFDIAIYGDHAIIAEKPKDEKVFAYVAERSGIPAEYHVYIGDREKADILSPKAVGMKTIAVGNNITGADAWVSRIYEIQNLLL